MSANFNNSAWFYDKLSRLVFGRAIINAQVYLLQYIPENANILIVGGGTGWLLDEITKLQASGLTIAYVEVSSKMTALSKKRNIGHNRVTFINEAIEDADLHPGFDTVITPFLFDNFTEQTLQKVFKSINVLLKPGGLWLNCNFQLSGKWWQRFLLKSMFLFFRLICSIEASKLPDIEKQFEALGYEIIAERAFYGEFMISRIYKQ